MSCLGILKQLANLNLKFRRFKARKTLKRIYLKVESNKYSTNKVLRSYKARSQVQIINFQVKNQEAITRDVYRG